MPATIHAVNISMNCRRRRYMPRASVWIVAGDNSCRNKPSEPSFQNMPKVKRIEPETVGYILLTLEVYWTHKIRRHPFEYHIYLYAPITLYVCHIWFHLLISYKTIAYEYNQHVTLHVSNWLYFAWSCKALHTVIDNIYIGKWNASFVWWSVPIHN